MNISTIFPCKTGPDTQNSPELTTLCGRPADIQPIESLSSFMTILFHSDQGAQFKGFNLTYQQGNYTPILSLPHDQEKRHQLKAIAW